MDLGPIWRAMLRNKLRFGLIIAQIAFTVATVANCWTLINDARQKMSHPITFDDDNLIVVEIPCPDLQMRGDRSRTVAWGEENHRRLQRITGVRAVATTNFKPFVSGWRGEIKAAGTAAMTPIMNLFSDEHLPDVIGVELDEGRWYSREEVEYWEEYWRHHDQRERDANGKVLEPVVVDGVITRALGQHFFGDGPLVGKLLEDHDGDFLRVIGVVRHYYVPRRPTTIHPEHAIFGPGFHYSCGSWGANFLIRTEPGQASTVGRRIEEEFGLTLDSSQKSVRLVSEGKGITYGTEQMTVGLMGILIVLLLAVASLGIAGLSSFSVTERTRQIGVRRAIGASTNDILQHFLTESGIVTTLGLVMGSGLAFVLNMALLRIYDSAKLTAPVVGGCALLLWIIALGAALPPALRASRISPAIATRNV